MRLQFILLCGRGPFALLGLLILLPLVVFQFPLVFAEPSALPAISYISATNTLTLGNTESSQPASESITIPALAALLTDQGLANLLLDQGNRSWLLKANVVIERSARLEATAATMDRLLLDSPPVAPVTVIARRGGYLRIEGIQVTSWDSTTNTVDNSIANGRSYLLALEGGRMDVLQSEISYLGASGGEPSGLSWRKRLKDDDPTTGATGRLEESKIHHNYFGMYSYEAYGLTILHNEVYENLYYGIDPHDNSQAFEVAYNKVHHNGAHGIIFSRLCVNNTIHTNEVYANAQHGIMLDRGTNNNTVRDNLIYNNQDGIAIFQSSDNIIRNNTIRQNLRGIRINATYDETDVYDGISTNNQILDNQIEDSTEQGVYLYARADRNVFKGNQILRSGLNGFYIKTGGNRLENNQILSGTVGITVIGGDVQAPLPALPALEIAGNQNLIISTTIVANRDAGIRLLGGSYNRIGPTVAGEQGNRIEANGKDGIAIGDATTGASATDNVIVQNSIRRNTRHGILITDSSSARNRISMNSITGNGQLGIKVEQSAQQSILPPVITTVAPNYILGTTIANAQVEVYSDPGDPGQRLLTQVSATTGGGAIQAAADVELLTAYSLTDYEGQLFLGDTVAGADGVWNFALPAGQNPDQVSVLAIDGQGNTSAFSGSAKGVTEPVFEIKVDDKQQKMIQVSGIGAEVTLPKIKSALGAADVDLLQEVGNQTWLLNANLLLGIGVTLNLSPTDGVQELRLRSQASGAARAAAIDYASFVYIRAYNSEINIDNVKIFSWDPQVSDYDRNPDNGRAYITAKYQATMNIRNSDIGYLGADDGESYGLTWRDVNEEPTVLLTRVTGEVIDSLIHHNYYGVYTYQASNMLFRGNQFYENVRYGFDPHDFSHSFVVENNQAYNNGAHGFIISRGCNNFTIRNNISYNNTDPSTSLAHGFMLDPGSPTSSDPQAPSYDNLLENNEAYGNEGYGLRILGSTNNEILGNYFHHNEMGVSLELGSTGNQVINNRLNNNTRYGLFIQETADKNMVRTNEMMNNGDNGIYIRSAHENQIEANMVKENAKAGIALIIRSGFTAPRNNVLKLNTVTGNFVNGIDLRGAQGTLAESNLVEQNKGDGVYLKDSTTQTSLVDNCLCRNTGYGIEINGVGTLQNTWSRNATYANGLGGIVATGGVVLLAPPQLLSLTTDTLTGSSGAGATIEIFADTGGQGQYYQGRVTAGADGNFSFTSTGWLAANITAIALDPQGNASTFSNPLVTGVTVTPTPTTPPATPTPSGRNYLPLITTK